MLPSPTIALFDQTHTRFGTIRLVPKTADAVKGDCIFDVQRSAEGTRNEVRWLAKRHYESRGEHRFVIDAAGRITISQADFRLVLDPDDDTGGLRTVPPQPLVWASWAPE